jgi:hypothetical protein
MGGGMEAIYDDMPGMGMSRFAPVRPARGAEFSSWKRAGRDEEPVAIPVVAEADYYSESS